MRFISRLHLGVGIMSYLSSPLWLVMMGIGFALAIQSHLIRPEYFSHDFQLFPTWPRFDVALMMALFWFSMVVLLIPKMIGLIRALLSSRIRRGAGGVIGVTASFVLEAILSALYAPILMIIQCRHVFEVFMGRDSGWKPQRRDAGTPRGAMAWRFHRRHMLLSCVTAVIVYFHLAAAARLGVARAARPVSFRAAIQDQRQRRVGADSCRASRCCARRKKWKRRHWSRAARNCCARAMRCPTEGLRFLARHREARHIHINGNLPRPADPRGQPDAHAFTAEQKLDGRKILG